ncbi:MAG: DHH family phosphoesterase [Coriobacteriia bacterium]|nr:DHH family phosphoesterase [Coriobacteriia bacterium]
MIAESDLTAAAALLRGAPSVVCASHVRPDGDAVGSVLALVHALRETRTAAVPTLADERPAPATYAFLPGFEGYIPAADLDPPAVFVSLDAPNLDRLGVAERLAAGADARLVIDHHPDNRRFGTVNLVDADAPASACIVWRLLPHLGVKPNPDIATCLYTALLTDTGRFAYGNTTPAAFRAAAEMLEIGVDAAWVARNVYESRSPGALTITGRALDRLTVTNRGHVAYSWIDDRDFSETGALPEETEHLVDMLRMLGGVDVVVFVRDRGGELRVNLRAKRGFDVGSVARTFGGGGHTAAAGLTYRNGDLRTFLGRVLPMLPGGEAA